MITVLVFLAYRSYGRRHLTPEEVVMIGVIYAILICFPIVTIGMKKYMLKQGRSNFIKTMKLLISEGVLKPFSHPDVFKTLDRLLQTLLNPKLARMTFDIFSISVREYQNISFYFFGFQQTKIKNELVRVKGGERSVEVTYKDNRLGIYAPINLGKISPISVRCRLQGKEEEEVSFYEGDSTPPDVGIPEFDIKFVVKGSHPRMVGQLLSLDLQKVLVDYYGNYPMVSPGLNVFRLFIYEEGFFIYSDISWDANQIKYMLSMAENIYPHLNKTSSDDRDEEIIRFPG